jgi:hypothetical protein
VHNEEENDINMKGKSWRNALVNGKSCSTCKCWNDEREKKRCVIERREIERDYESGGMER